MESAPLTFEDLICARLLMSENLTTKVLLETVERIMSESDNWKQATHETITRLHEAGHIASLGRSRYHLTQTGTAQILARLGLKQVSPKMRWVKLKDTYLQALALQLPPPRSDKELQRLTNIEGLRAAILGRYYALPLKTPYPTLIEARNMLLWRQLMQPDTARRLQLRQEDLLGKTFSHATLMNVLCNDLLQINSKLEWEKALMQLVIKITGARNSNHHELRNTVLRRALTNHPIASIQQSASQMTKAPVVSIPLASPSQVAPMPNLDEFARIVLETARATPTGRFGDKMVFISHVWDQLQQNGQDFGLTEQQFKQQLGFANNKLLLRLSRADMAHALDQNDVQRSETQYLNATFHFIRLD